MGTRSPYGTQRSLSSLLALSGRKHLSQSFSHSFPGNCSDSSSYSVSEPVVDLDWTATPDGQSILAIGFPHHVLLLYQQRMTYFDQEPRWGILDKYDISQCVFSFLWCHWKLTFRSRVTLHTITDSIWLSGARFLIASGHQMFLTGRPGVDAAGKPKEDLFRRVVRRNGPLPDCHPQMLLQLLLWGTFKLHPPLLCSDFTSGREIRTRKGYYHEARIGAEVPDER